MPLSFTTWSDHVRAVLSIAFLALLTSAAFAQEQPAADAGEPKTEKPEAPTKVDVQPVARDEQIQTRLENILVATEWFAEPDVDVKDGVVFLTGEASEQDFRGWATDLARSTQDVAAVVNQMTVKQRPVWDMSPAFAELKTLVGGAIQTVPLLIFGCLIIGFTWMFARIVRRFANWAFQKRIANQLLRSVVAKALMLPVLLLGIYIVLRVSGLTQLALTVLGGTGIAGLILGIAFRDIAENFLASVLISVQNPFRAGDLVEVNENCGFVQRVSTRGTLLMTLDGNHVMVPNAIIYKSVVTNFSANPNRRVEFVVGIGYDDSITAAQKVVKRVLDEHPHVLAEPESRVVLDELGASTVNLRVYVWLDASKTSPDATRSSVMRIVKQSLLREGISLPDEAREVIFPNQVPVRMLTDSDSNQSSGSIRSGDAAELKRRERANEHEEEVIAPGEGTQSEAEEIQRQADQSWTPEEGTNLLSDESSDVPSNAA